MGLRHLFDGFCALIGAMAIVRVAMAILLALLGEWGPEEGIATVLFAWASIEAMGQVRKFVGS